MYARTYVFGSGGKCHAVKLRCVMYTLRPAAENIETNGQSNLSYGRIAAAHGPFSRIRQVATMCIPPNTWLVPWTRPSPHPKRHLDRFSHACRTHDRDRPTDRPRYSVCNVGRVHEVLRCDLKTKRYPLIPEDENVILSMIFAKVGSQLS